MEIWKAINGYEGLYEVSNLGNVRSLDRKCTFKGKVSIRKGCLLKKRIDRYGYYYFILCKDGKIKNFRAHRLVAEAFIPNEENKTQIDHINTIRTDNRVENLRWVTSKENSNNPLSLNNYSMGQKKRFGLVC